jgi:Fe-S oxidoreductase
MLKKILKDMGARKKDADLFFPGCLLKAADNSIIENYRKILDDLGQDYIETDEVGCCGGPALSAGFPDVFEDLKLKNAKELKKQGIRRIITVCPSCAYIFKKRYKIEALHITELIAEKSDRISDSGKEEISYHDPCRLGRGMGIYSAPREILRSLGLDLVEFEENRSSSMCCGAGGNLNAYSKDISNAIARKRLKSLKTKKVVTSCPLCYLHLKRNAPENTEVLEMSQLLVGNIR